MKAISIHPEYVGEISEGTKTEEYRTWKTDYRGDLLICTTKTDVSPGFAALVVELYDIADAKDGVYAWKLRNVRATFPFPVKGRQRLYDVDDALIRAIPITKEPNPEWDAAYDEFRKAYCKN